MSKSASILLTDQQQGSLQECTHSRLGAGGSVCTARERDALQHDQSARDQRKVLYAMTQSTVG